MTDTTPVVGDVWEWSGCRWIVRLVYRCVIVYVVETDCEVCFWTMKEWHAWAANARKVT
jgi:hypothetical protein